MLFEGPDNCSDGLYGGLSGLCFKLGTKGHWTNNCFEQNQNNTKYELLAINIVDVKLDLESLKKNFSDTYWVRGTNMRWVWIMGMILII